MPEREYVERIVWNTNSIVDAAIDASIEVLKVEGNVSLETRRRVGEGFGMYREHRQTFSVSAERTLLLAFIPPLELSINPLDLDEGELSAEARLVVFNPLREAEVTAIRKKQMELIISASLKEVSKEYRLKLEQTTVVAFPREHYALGVERYNLPRTA